jgi:hypothetical protein
MKDCRCRPIRKHAALDLLGLLTPALALRLALFSGSGAVYFGVPSMARYGLEPPTMLESCPANANWRLMDVIDVADAESEAAHGYQIEGATWGGTRRMGVPGIGPIVDGGRAFVGSQRFEVSNLVSGARVCLVKRLDPRVRSQISAWLWGNRPVGQTESTGAVEGDWGTVSLVIDGQRVDERPTVVVERFLRSTLDVNTFRIDVYQDLQPQ